MIAATIQAALNNQLNEEFSSAYGYLSVSAYFENIDLRGCAHWMKLQYQEELIHADKIYTFINDRDGQVTLQPIVAPPIKWDSPLHAFESALQGEQHLSEKIYQVVDLALKEHDHATHAFMQWFVNEQVEEEAMVRDIVRDLKLLGDSKDGLFLMDRDLASRQPGPDRDTQTQG